VAVTGDVNIDIPYSGAFGGTHNGQTVTSTGVTGLTATLAAGTFANGSGNLTYVITGTPSEVGVASFAINIGGKTCVLTRPVVAIQLSTTIIDVTNPITGKTWMDRNLGASRVATSGNNDIESRGDLYQWGRGSDGHQKRNSGTTTTLSSSDVSGNGNFILAPNPPYYWRSPLNTNLWQGVAGLNNPCPSGYRIPTEAEWEAERLSWTGGNNAAGAFGSPLKLPKAGSRRYSNGSLLNLGSRGDYWSSTVSGTEARLLSFSDTNAYKYTYFHAYGLSVRCIKD
jgi:uncharacterized protein (TIGR02145 family)